MFLSILIKFCCSFLCTPLHFFCFLLSYIYVYLDLPSTHLLRSVLEDLEEPVFSNLFSVDWETTFGETLSSVMVRSLAKKFTVNSVDEQ